MLNLTGKLMRSSRRRGHRSRTRSRWGPEDSWRKAALGRGNAKGKGPGTEVSEDGKAARATGTELQGEHSQVTK